MLSSTPAEREGHVHLMGEGHPAKPGLILFSAVFGGDDDMKRLAGKWAERGFLVAVPDYYHRVGAGVRDRSEDGRKAAMARWKSLDVDSAIADIGALRDFMLHSPSCNGRIAALGVCAGGELAFLAATRLGVQAAAAYHGTHIDRHLNEAKRINVPISLHLRRGGQAGATGKGFRGQASPGGKLPEGDLRLPRRGAWLQFFRPAILQRACSNDVGPAGAGCVRRAEIPGLRTTW